MKKSLPLLIGFRYLSAKRRNHFISFISASSMVGMTLGVAVLILVLSVMNGFDRELRERILGMVPHGVVYERGGVQDWQALAKKVEAIPGVVAAAPLTRLQGMFAYQGRVQGAMVTGIEPSAESRVSILPNHIIEGELSSLHSGGFNVVLGAILAQRLNLMVGDKVTLMLPEATLSPAGILPRIKRLTVSGIFSVGAELDANLAVIHIEDARKLARLAGEAQALRIKTVDLFTAPKLVWTLVSEVDGIYSGSDWTRTHGNLFQAIKMEKTMIGLLLLIIVAVAAFNIISTLVMVVTDKQAGFPAAWLTSSDNETILNLIMQFNYTKLLALVYNVLFGPKLPVQ